MTLGEHNVNVFSKDASVRNYILNRAQFLGFADELNKLAAKLAFQVSEYSGPLSMGRFPQVSSQPGFRAPNVRAKPFAAPPQQIHEGGIKIGALISPTTVGSPKAQLGSSMRIGRPRVTAPPGPSIHQVAKPKGFGSPIPGAKKSVL